MELLLVGCIMFVGFWAWIASGAWYVGRYHKHGLPMAVNIIDGNWERTRLPLIFEAWFDGWLMVGYHQRVRRWGEGKT
jgi:hypothetical protein